MDFSNTQSLVPCRHCAELLQEGDRFCRFCGQDQWDGDIIDVSIPAKLEHGLPMLGRSALATGGARTYPVVRRHVAEHPAPEPDTPEMWEREARGGSPVMMGIAMLLMLLFGVVLVYDLYSERQRDAERLTQLGVQVEQMQRALDQGELGAVERIMRSLGDADSADPRVAALKSTLRRQQEALRAPVEEVDLPTPAAVPAGALAAASAATQAAAPPVASPPPPPAITPTPMESAAALPASAVAPTAPPSTDAPSGPAASSPTTTASSATRSVPTDSSPANVTPSSLAPPSDNTPASAAPPVSPSAAADAQPDATFDPTPNATSGCSEALAAMSLCTLP